MAGIQLRRYEINPGEMEQFVVAWRGVKAIREKYGFRVEFAFVNEEAYEFVWALTCDDDFAAAESEYYASPSGQPRIPTRSTTSQLCTCTW